MEKKQCELVVLIQSCRKFVNRRNNCRQTWLTHVPEGVEYFFGVGDKSATEVTPIKNEPHVLAFPCADDYSGLREKTLAMLQYAVDHYDFRYLFKCDDDTYVALDRLLKLANEYGDPIFLSNVMWTGADYTISGGAGYLLSRGNVDIVLEEHENAPPEKVREAEDMMVQYALQQRDILPITTTLFYRGYEIRVPGKDNEVVTAHRLQSAEMNAVEAIRYSPTAKHALCIQYNKFQFAPLPSITFIPEMRMYVIANFSKYFGQYSYDPSLKKLSLYTKDLDVATVLDYTGDGYWEEEKLGPFAIVSPITPEELEGKELQTE